MRFRVIPVIDLQSGRAVHARGGLRRDYRPVVSVLNPGHDPLALAASYRDRLGLTEVYVADLDAIAGSGDHLDPLRRIAGLGLAVWADAGLRDSRRALGLREAGVSVVVAATETLSGTAGLADTVAAVGAGSVALSLDVREGHLVLSTGSTWTGLTTTDVCEEALRFGVKRQIRLNLARIGGETGADVPASFFQPDLDTPGLELFVGGGVSDVRELESLRTAGAAGVLLASALHSGRIRRDDLRRLREGD